jgi:hypothetical protein
MELNNELASTSSSLSATAEANTAKAVQEVQASLIIAQKFPRNLRQVRLDLEEICSDKGLAEESQYAYKRGSSMVTGASIRLAEVLAQNYGNISFGFRELSQGDDYSEVEAFAWDLQKNTKVTRVFQVSHYRSTRAKGRQRLTDDRDIYELIANNAQRRVRACILGVIPKNFQDNAVALCNKALASSDIPLAQRIDKLTSAFKELGVTIEMIEGNLGHSLEACNEQSLIKLRAIYKSLKDKMSTREDWFELPKAEKKEALDMKDIVKGLEAKK